MKKIWILLLLTFSLICLYGCGQVSKETSGSNAGNLTPEQQGIQTLLTSFSTAAKNKDTTAMALLFTDDSPIKSQYIEMFSSPNITNISYDSLTLTLVSTTVSGNYIYAKFINNYQQTNSALKNGSIYYSDNQCLRISTANSIYKIYDGVNNYQLSSANRNVWITVNRNSNNSLNILIESNNLNNKAYNIDGASFTSNVSNNYYYANYPNNSFTIKEENTVLGQYDFSSLTSYYSDNTWIANAIAKGVNYGIVTLNFNEGYVFSSKEITTNTTNSDFMIRQGSSAYGYTADFQYNINKTVYRAYNSPSCNINGLIDIDFYESTLDADISSAVHMKYMNLVKTNNKYYALQTIDDNYPNGPVVFAWVELMNIGTRWYINQ